MKWEQPGYLEQHTGLFLPKVYLGQNILNESGLCTAHPHFICSWNNTIPFVLLRIFYFTGKAPLNNVFFKSKVKPVRFFPPLTSDDVNNSQERQKGSVRHWQEMQCQLGETCHQRHFQHWEGLETSDWKVKHSTLITQFFCKTKKNNEESKCQLSLSSFQKNLWRLCWSKGSRIPNILDNKSLVPSSNDTHPQSSSVSEDRMKVDFPLKCLSVKVIMTLSTLPSKWTQWKCKVQRQHNNCMANMKDVGTSWTSHTFSPGLGIFVVRSY